MQRNKRDHNGIESNAWMQGTKAVTQMRIHWAMTAPWLKRVKSRKNLVVSNGRSMCSKKDSHFTINVFHYSFYAFLQYRQIYILSFLKIDIFIFAVSHSFYICYQSFQSWCFIFSSYTKCNCSHSTYLFLSIRWHFYRNKLHMKSTFLTTVNYFTATAWRLIYPHG